jgi:hypothetical protein
MPLTYLDTVAGHPERPRWVETRLTYLSNNNINPRSAPAGLHRGTPSLHVQKAALGPPEGLESHNSPLCTSSR